MYSGADTGKHSQSGFMYLMGMQEGINETLQVWRPGEQCQVTGSIAFHFSFFLSRPGLPMSWLSLSQLDLLLESPRDPHVSASEVLDHQHGLLHLPLFYFIFYNMGLGLGPRPVYLHDKHFVN